MEIRKNLHPDSCYVVVEAWQDNDWEDVLTEEEEHGEHGLHHEVGPVLHADGEGGVLDFNFFQGLQI